MSSPASPKSPENKPSRDVLPPVEAPSAGFIVQLFVIPALIVGVIVAVWGGLQWLTPRENDPKKLIQSISANNAGSWQSASALAELLRGKNSSIRNDPQYALQLADLLRQELKKDDWSKKEDTQLRGFLCRALGEFQIPDGVPALVEAASLTSAGNEEKLKVRRAAIEGLAVSATNVGVEHLQSRSDVLPCLQQGAQDEEWGIRSPSAFALGILGGPEAKRTLGTLLEDQIPNVRYNAATGLARQGDARCAPVLIEMLQPELLSKWEQEGDSLRRVHTGLQAAETLARADSSSDLALLGEAILALKSNVKYARLQTKADSVWRLHFQNRSASPKPGDAGSKK